LLLTHLMANSDASDAVTGWSVGEWLFPKAVELLRVREYRQPLLIGLILSVGTRTGSTVCLTFSFASHP
jgi:tubulin-specific chaperone D